VSPTIAYARLRDRVRPHADLLANSTSLIATSAVTSAFGFVFWWFAARTASPSAVGQASAAVSAMTFVGMIGMAGLGTLLISELPAMTTGRWRLISACVLVSAAIGLVGGVIYVAAVDRFHLALGAVVVILAIVVTAGTLVLDEGLIGLLAGRIQLVRNTWFAGGKLVLLGACALAPIAITATDIVGVWLLAAVLSLVAVAVAARAKGLGGSLRPDFARLRSVRGRAMDHNLLNLALYLPRALLPVIVTLVVSAEANAGFYTAWMIVTVLAMIPSHFATALFAVARDVEALRSKVRVALLVSLGLGVPLSLLVAIERDRIMAIFGSGYVALGAAPLGILAMTYVPTVVRQLYVGVSRATGRVRRATAVALTAGLVEVGVAVAAGATGGVDRMAWALAVVFVVEGAVMTPTLVRCLRH
jgi:O-antigen/teichoic acid export membrane protein